MIPTLVKAAADKHGLAPAIVLGLVRVESSANRFAWNPESAYPYLWNVRTGQPFRALTADERKSATPPGDFPTLAGDRDQEWTAQRASWGLMQLMGAVARERGFSGLYLTELIDPVVNLEIGCAHLAALFRWSTAAGGGELRALAAWNGGKANNTRPPYAQTDYAMKVLAVARGITDF